MGVGQTVCLGPATTDRIANAVENLAVLPGLHRLRQGFTPAYRDRYFELRRRSQFHHGSGWGSMVNTVNAWFKTGLLFSRGCSGGQ